MKVLDRFTINNRCAVCLDQVPWNVTAGDHVRQVDGDGRWEIIGVELFGNGRPGALLLDCYMGSAPTIGDSVGVVINGIMSA